MIVKRFEFLKTKSTEPFRRRGELETAYMFISNDLQPAILAKIYRSKTAYFCVASIFVPDPEIKGQYKQHSAGMKTFQKNTEGKHHLVWMAFQRMGVWFQDDEVYDPESVFNEIARALGTEGRFFEIQS